MHTLSASIDALQDALNVGHFGDRGADFPASLIRQYKAKGSLSEKQTYWAHKLADEFKNPAAAPEGTKVAQTFAGVLALFNKAKGPKLQTPTIWLMLEDGQPVITSLAADHSKNPGHLYVKLPESIGYAGKVSPDGQFFAARDTDAETAAQIVKLLERLGADPIGVATEHAKLTGRCCFCDILLDNEKSVAVGYGPTCAKHYGLPYGVNAMHAANASKEVVIANKTPSNPVRFGLEAPLKPVPVLTGRGEPDQLPLSLDEMIAEARS